MRGAGEGADVLVHLASRISGSEDECAAVNVHGTTALVEEARRCGVGRIVQLSTAAVYGPGPHRGIAVDEVVPAPVSPASRTRLRGERAAVAAGGTVLRPGLVTGAGDRWVVPALADLREHVPARWNGGRGLASMVDVDDLARLIVRLATTPERPPGGTFHASHPRPVRNRDLMAALGDARGGAPGPGGGLAVGGLSAAAAALAQRGERASVRAAGGRPLVRQRRHLADGRVPRGSGAVGPALGGLGVVQGSPRRTAGERRAPDGPRRGRTRGTGARSGRFRPRPGVPEDRQPATGCLRACSALSSGTLTRGGRPPASGSVPSAASPDARRR
ncbi:SDR family oxidoreductase [Streptomyces tricolor]|nr:SDR family oxidoreductase [Streptomyces tricolor]